MIIGVKSPTSSMGGASKPTLSKSMSMDVGKEPVPIMEDEYIEMDAVPQENSEPTSLGSPGMIIEPEFWR